MAGRRRNGIIRKIVCLLFALLSAFAVVGACTVTGHGFLDVSNLVRAVLVGIAAVCAVLSWAIHRMGSRGTPERK